MISQRAILAGYSDTHREDFNLALFQKSEDEIIKHLENVILSSQRDKFFVIKVNYFKVIDDYREINAILHELESNKNRKNKRIKINKYDYIDLKDSDIKLLEVGYHLEADDNSADIKVYISVPRIVDRYYFRISGSMYSAMYQIVDGSTYNNSSTSNKKADPCVTLKTPFMKTSTYIRSHTLVDINKEHHICNCFTSDIFASRFPSMKYILAKFGWYGTLSFLHISDLRITDYPVEDDKFVCFEKSGVYVSTPLFYYQNSDIIQSLIYTVLYMIPKDSTVDYNHLFETNFWKECLGAEYKTKTVAKGESVLDSFEHIYDNKSRDIIRLPMEQKKDIYCVLRWIMYEFNSNRIKDNTDLSIKRIRCEEYIASLYAIKLSSNIYRISNPNNKITLNKLISTVSIKYSYLLDQLKSCKLVPYKNSVNDNDALSVLKFTYKGISGIGEKKSSAVPNKYRLVNASQLGRVDLDSSSNSDPGMSGTLCPYVQLYEGGALSDYKEPNSWERSVDSMVDNYKKANNLIDLFQAKQEILGTDESENISRVVDSVESIERIMSPFIHISSNSEIMDGIPLEGSGLICLENRAV